MEERFGARADIDYLSVRLVAQVARVETDLYLMFLIVDDRE
jgi:hypothetical protein